MVRGSYRQQTLYNIIKRMYSLRYLTLLFFMALSLAACASSTDSADENNNNNNNVTAPEGKVVATIDGVTRTYDATTVKSQSRGKDVVTIDGMLMENNQMYRCRLTLYVPSAAGSYEIASTEDAGTAQAFIYLDNISYAPTSGTVQLVNVTEGKKFKGTFEYTAVDVLQSGKFVSVTKGSFNVVSWN